MKPKPPVEGDLGSGDSEAPSDEDAAPTPPAGADSFLWLVGSGIAEALLEARREGSRDEPDTKPTEAQLARDAERRARRRGYVWRLVGGTLGACVAVYLAAAELDLLVAVPVVAVILSIWVLFLAYVARGLLALDHARERDAAQRQLDLINAAMLRAQRAGDAERLQRRYVEYLDWAEILAWIVHRPWTEVPLSRVEGFGTLHADTMPAAMQIGVAMPSDKHFAQLVSQGRTLMFSPGWLSSLFRAVQRRVRSDDESSRQSALDGAFDEGLDPEGDVSEDEESPRRVLLAAVRRGDGRRLDDNPLSRDLLEMIDRMPLDAVAPEVQVARAGDARPIQAMPAAVSWFDAPEDLDEIAAPLRPFAVRIRAGDVEFAGAIVGGTVVTAVNGDEATPLLVSAGDAAQRAMSGKGRAGPLALLADDPMPPEGAHPADKDGSPNEDGDAAASAQPEPLPKGFVLATAELVVGDPVLGIGTESTSWGLVTATPPGEPARVTFRHSPGPAGTPLVDLDGRLMGIQAWPPPPRRGVVQPPNEARVHGIHLLRRLIAGEPDADEAPETEPVESRSRSANLARMTPTAFLAEPYTEAEGMSLLPQHWHDRRDGHFITGVAPQPPNLSPATADVGVLSTGARFHEPLRVLVQRVDLTDPVPAEQLQSCREAPQLTTDVPYAAVRSRLSSGKGGILLLLCRARHR